MASSKDRISFLLNAWSEGSISVAEEKELYDLILSKGKKPVIDAHTLYLLEEGQGAVSAPVVDWDGLFDRIMRQRKTSQERKPAVLYRVAVNWSSWGRYVAAAGIVLMVGLGAWLLIGRHDTSTRPVVAGGKQDIAPGKDRARLLLADGKAVDLDSTHGVLASHGLQTITNGSGSIAYTGEGSAEEYNTLTTPRGGQYRLQLPDGTKAWLNAASSITFPTAFGPGERNISITGEVYIEVARDPRRPFHVQVKDISIDVLGTHFNINSYEDEDGIRTTLLEGSIRVTRGREKMVLLPGQQAKEETALRLADSVDLEAVMAWKNGTFVFNESPLQDVMRQLARWYDVDIVYPSGVPDIRLGGEMKRDLDLSQVLKGLGKVGVNFRIEGKQLIVLP